MQNHSSGETKEMKTHKFFIAVDVKASTRKQAQGYLEGSLEYMREVADDEKRFGEIAITVDAVIESMQAEIDNLRARLLDH